MCLTSNPVSSTDGRSSFVTLESGLVKICITIPYTVSSLLITERQPMIPFNGVTDFLYFIRTLDFMGITESVITVSL